MGWLSLRRPQGQDTAAAVIFGVLYGFAFWYARHHGWYPTANNAYQFKLAGAFTVAVLLTRERLPLSTLLVTVVFYPALYGSGLQMQFQVLPVLFAAYTVAAKGRLRTVWVLLLAAEAVTQLVLPWRTWSYFWDYPKDLWNWNISQFTLLPPVTLMVVLLGRASYRQKQAAGQLLTRNHELERLRSVETDRLVSAERTRIARELHDVVAHHISAVVIRAQAADRVADNRPEETREAVRWIAANGQQTLAAMRQVVRVLRSAETSGPLAPQTTLAELPEIAERMAAVGLPVELRLPSVVPTLPAAVELATVRIIQEALTNVLVHAKATRALVELSLADDVLRLAVHDDGSNESPPTKPLRLLAVAAAAAGTARPAEPALPVSASVLGGNGLIGMRERATSCGGTLSIGVSPLGGWLVSATLRTSLPSPAGSRVAARAEVHDPVRSDISDSGRAQASAHTTRAAT